MTNRGMGWAGGLRGLAALAMCVAAGAAPLAAQSGASEAVAALRTAPESTNYQETTRYADVVAWMETVAAASPVIQLDTFGYTQEGRALPLAVVSRLSDPSPEAVRASGKTVLYLQGNIHAGEVEGKESLLMLLREIAQGRHQQLLDSLVLLIAPIYNADGNERVLLTNRPAHRAQGRHPMEVTTPHGRGPARRRSRRARSRG